VLYARIVFAIPVEGPFDYIVPGSLYKKIKVGSRVWVNFRTQKAVGYVVGLTKETKIKQLKEILEVIDDLPILDKYMLSLTKELSDYYCCSWGEAIETAIPQSLRKGKKISIDEVKYNEQENRAKIILIHDLTGTDRWDIYLAEIKQTLENQRSVIVLLPDMNSVLKAKEKIARVLGFTPLVLYRNQPQELEEWVKIKQGKINIVIGMRSGIFAPFSNLGLIIIDEEHDSAYKQDQVPHYHAREVAFMRNKLQNTKLILGSSSPPLETFHLARENKIQYIYIAQKSFAEIKIIDMRQEYYRLKKEILSKYLKDLMLSSLNMQSKILLYSNRRGFATVAACRYCGMVLKCPRCNINLVYHFKDNILNCHYCNSKIPPPKICPNCNSSYIRYLGMGSEKIESELHRIFPQAKIKRWDKSQNIELKDIDIVVATKSIIKERIYHFDLVGVFFIDNALNRIDFRASEKTFHLLVGLLGLTQKTLVIQTNLAGHYIFRALVNNDINIFYDEELRQRKLLKLPPYQHLGLVKLRGKKEERVKKLSNILFEKLNKDNKNIKIISFNPAEPSKLRGKFCWQILVKSRSPQKISKFLKLNLKDFTHSGIIVTVDIDPI
jgi:primosomal protein N' (replication factor Y)